MRADLLPVTPPQRAVERLNRQARAWHMDPMDLFNRMLDAVQQGVSLQRLGRVLDQ